MGFKNITKKIYLLLSCLVVTVSLVNVSPYQASAINCDTSFFSGNDILHLACGDQQSNTCVASGSLTAPAPTSLVGSEKAEKVWNYFIARGLTPIAAAGAMGNIEQESPGFNPWAGENGNSSIVKTLINVGFGLIQWTNTGGNPQGRRYGVMEYMESKGITLNATDQSQTDKAILEQLNWLWDGEYGGMTWQEEVNAESKIDGDTSINFRADNTGNGSALLFHKLVERSADGAKGLQERIDSAQKYFDMFASGSGCGETIQDGGLTEEQAKKLMIEYGRNTNNESVIAMNSGSGRPGAGCRGGPLSNCVSFTAFFVNKFTNLDYGGGNGNQVVSRLQSKGAKTGSTPKPFAVFSNGLNTAAGHTGIILGIEGDKLIVGHASCSHPGTGPGNGLKSGMGAGYIIVGTVDTGALSYKDKPVYAYPDEVDTNAILKYINE